MLEWDEEGFVRAFWSVVFDKSALVDFAKGGLEAGGLLGKGFARGEDVVS